MTFGFKVTQVAGSAISRVGKVFVPSKKSKSSVALGLRSLFALGILGVAVSPSFGQSSTSDYRALITDGGFYKLLSNGQQTMVVRYGLFYDNWNELRQTEVGRGADGSFQSTAPLAVSGSMSVKTYVNVSGLTARLTIQATPTRSLAVNSSHINIRFDEGFWAGGNFSANGWSAMFPRRYDQTIGSTGRTSSSFVVSSPSGLGLTVQFPSSAPYLLQDSRRYGVGFELRANASGNNTWNANETRTFVVDLTPNQAMVVGPNTPVSAVAGSEWIPLVQQLGIKAGSALDWTEQNRPVAGSKGWLKTTADGKFYFENEPGTRVRFYGTNLSGSAVCMPNASIDKLVSNLARMGYNAVRLHHIDVVLQAQSSTTSTNFDPFYLPKFLYLLEQLRLKGFYVYIDLHSLRAPKSNEVFSGSLTPEEYKLLLLAHPTVRQNWFTFSKNLLETVSPYTGRMLKDEPAIAMLDMVNEQHPLWYPRGSVRSDVLDYLQSATGATWSVSSDADARRARDMLANTYNWMKTQLRGIGVKALLTSINAGQENALTQARGNLDFQDEHVYFAHPQWLSTPWELPYQQLGKPPLADMNKFGLVSVARVHNKPFVMGEYDAVVPSPYRGEIGLYFGAMAGVQKWDGIFRFGYTDRIQYIDNIYAAQPFATVTDPAGIASETAVRALYGRGDLQCNDTTRALYVDPATAGKNNNGSVPLVMNGALSVPMASSNSVGDPNPASMIVDGTTSNAEGNVKSDLFQRWLLVNTPKTVGVTASAGTTLTAGVMTATINGCRASVWASSVDGLSLVNSHRVLVTHLTEVQNSGTTWNGPERTAVTSIGTLPHLARRGSVKLTFNVDRSSTAKVYRLNMAGDRVATVAQFKVANGIGFAADTVNPLDGSATVFYEIIK